MLFFTNLPTRKEEGSALFEMLGPTGNSFYLNVVGLNTIMSITTFLNVAQWHISRLIRERLLAFGLSVLGNGVLMASLTLKINFDKCL